MGGQPALRVAWTNAIDSLFENNATGNLDALCTSVVTKLVPLVSAENNVEVHEAQIKTVGRWLSKSPQFSAESAKLYAAVLGDPKKQDKAKWYLESLSYSVSLCPESLNFNQKFKQIPEDLSKALFQHFDKVKQRTTLRAEGLLVAFFFAKVSAEATDSSLAPQIQKAGVWDYLFSDQSFFLNNTKEFVLRLDAEFFPTLIRFIQLVSRSEFFGKYWKTNDKFFSLMLETMIQGSWQSRQLALRAVAEAHEFNDELSERLLATFSNSLAQVRFLFICGINDIRVRLLKTCKLSVVRPPVLFLPACLLLFLTTKSPSLLFLLTIPLSVC